MELVCWHCGKQFAVDEETKYCSSPCAEANAIGFLIWQLSGGKQGGPIRA